MLSGKMWHYPAPQPLWWRQQIWSNALPAFYAWETSKKFHGQVFPSNKVAENSQQTMHQTPRTCLNGWVKRRAPGTAESGLFCAGCSYFCYYRGETDTKPHARCMFVSLPRSTWRWHHSSAFTYRGTINRAAEGRTRFLTLDSEKL